MLSFRCFLKNVATAAFFFLIWSRAVSQPAFTELKYGFRVEKDIPYGEPTNYLGEKEILTLDLYKPVGDGNLLRPLIVLVHGGAWVGGCKEDVAWIAVEMAKRGYVAAAINYRKGWHKDDYVPAPIPPAVMAGGNCLYPADTAEVIRAIYRGMQDAKGAIRFLKARAAADSVCGKSLLIGGESAGAFIAMTAGFLDRPEEKPAACGALPKLPPPGSNLINCYAVNCSLQTFAATDASLNRPDLGGVEGDLNLNGFDTRPSGVISFFGGLPLEFSVKNWIKGPDTPAVYLYHQTCDGIVLSGNGKPFFTISAYCNLGYTPWHYNFPDMSGNVSISTYFSSLPKPPVYYTDFLECPPFNAFLALFECNRYAQNGSYHYTHLQPQRAEKVAAFFNPVIQKKRTECAGVTSTPGKEAPVSVEVSPNPFHDYLRIVTTESAEFTLTLFNAEGQIVWRTQTFLSAKENLVQLPGNLSGGLYWLTLDYPGGRKARKLHCEHP